jgi:hypothetical protein
VVFSFFDSCNAQGQLLVNEILDVIVMTVLNAPSNRGSSGISENIGATSAFTTVHFVAIHEPFDLGWEIQIVPSTLFSEVQVYFTIVMNPFFG